MVVKECSICKEPKLLTEFRVRKDVNRHRAECKECARSRDRRNRPKKPRGRIWKRHLMSLGLKHCNRCGRTKSRDDFYNANSKCDGKMSHCKECSAKKARETKSTLKSHNRRYKKDVLYTVKFNTRNLIRASIKGSGYRKDTKTFEILGCTPEFFKEYIESKFKLGMTWNNHGEWHLDHIIPMATAKTKEDVFKLNHYTNFQPLWAKENLAKGVKIPT